MNKNELVEAVASKANLTKKQGTDAVEALFASITKTLKSGGEVRIIGFGTFGVVQRKATTGRNPQTGKSMKIPAKKIAKFRPGKALKDAVK